MSQFPVGSLAIVIVTYNRLELLKGCLTSLINQSYPLNQVIVIDNASTDGTTEFLSAFQGLPLHVISESENSGGAGGFYKGAKIAFDQGFDWIFFMDDDVFPEKYCLERLMQFRLGSMIAVREDRQGRLVERSALHYDLKNPLFPNPKRCSISEFYSQRGLMPETVDVDNVAFEGFMIHRDIVQKVGFPEPKYFIFYDDVDYALRIRALGYKITAVRDAILVRQLDFNQQAALNSWKAYYMFRNLFHIHYKFGENFWVRNKPYFLALVTMSLAIVRGNIKQAQAILNALQDFKSLEENSLKGKR